MENLTAPEEGEIFGEIIVQYAYKVGIYMNKDGRKIKTDIVIRPTKDEGDEIVEEKNAYYTGDNHPRIENISPVRTKLNSRGDIMQILPLNITKEEEAHNAWKKEVA